MALVAGQKKKISHIFAFLEGDIKNRLRAQFYLTNFNGCWASIHGRFLNANLNSSAYKKESAHRFIIILTILYYNIFDKDRY